MMVLTVREYLDYSDGYDLLTKFKYHIQQVNDKSRKCFIMEYK